MSATTVSGVVRNESIVKTGITGAVAGLGGGLVFGMLMAMMGMLPMIGMLVRQNNALVGFAVHMAISAFIGATYAVAAGRLVTGRASAAVTGIANGVSWWVLGALILMPIGLGMPQLVFAVGPTQWMSLMGHLIYGVVTGLLWVALRKRL